MNSVLSNVRWSAPVLRAQALRRRWRACRGPWIFGRVACLGQDVLKELKPRAGLLNTQKGRVDYLLELRESSARKTRTRAVAPFMERADVVPLIAQEEMARWQFSRPPAVIVMDSFSELTDQRFVHRREGWAFNCNYSDLNHTPEFEAQFECVGLLPVEELPALYERFFAALRQAWGSAPILFLHFPVKLDTREKFHERHRHILATIGDLSKRVAGLHSLSVDDAIVDWPEVKVPGLEKFPYHYNHATYAAFAEQIRTLKVLD